MWCQRVQNHILHTSCTLLSKSVDTADLTGLYPNHIPKSKNRPRTTQQKSFALGDIYH